MIQYTLNIAFPPAAPPPQPETMTTAGGAAGPPKSSQRARSRFTTTPAVAPGGQQTGQTGGKSDRWNCLWKHSGSDQRLLGARAFCTFSIAVSQGVPGNDPETTDYGSSVPCGSAMQALPGYGRTTPPLTPQIRRPRRHIIRLAVWVKAAALAPNRKQSKSTLFRRPLQPGYLPLAVIYSPIGNKATASYTLSEINGTQISFGANVTAVNSLTSDDKEVQTGKVSGKGGSASLAGTWESSVETDEGSLYGQVATVTKTSEIDLQLSNTLPSTGPSSWPSTDKMDYYYEPFHHDIIVAAVNPQFMVWSYPEGFFTMPIGQCRLFFEATVDDLATCAWGIYRKIFRFLFCGSSPLQSIAFSRTPSCSAKIPRLFNPQIL